MSIFEQILHTNLINFIIVLSLLVLIFKKARLGDLIDKMADDIQDKVEKSAANAADAIKQYKETRKSVQDTQQIQEKILENAQRSAQNLKAKIEQKADEREKEIQYKVEMFLKSQKEKAKKMTVKEIYLACVDLAQEEIIKKLDNKTHKKLINNSIEELEHIEGRLS
ncbi:MAG: hypothetical protein IKL52_06745 [Candidatus Gastranaerophilales bacterium]|nr:hypothetical protein [Candidatus Gastranaerophilales bacterium]